MVSNLFFDGVAEWKPAITPPGYLNESEWAVKSVYVYHLVGWAVGDQWIGMADLVERSVSS